jgi:hypothetical protein
MVKTPKDQAGGGAKATTRRKTTKKKTTTTKWVLPKKPSTAALSRALRSKLNEEKQTRRWGTGVRAPNILAIFIIIYYYQHAL